MFALVPLPARYLSKHYHKKDFKRLREDRYLDFQLAKTSLIPIIFMIFFALQSGAPQAPPAGDDDGGEEDPHVTSTWEGSGTST